MSPWLEDPVAAALLLPPLVLPLFVFVSAFLEYVVPPYWGDTIMLAGFFLAAQGAGSPPVIFAMAFLGSILGAAVAYRLGERFGFAVLQRLPFVSRRSEERVERLFRRFGEPLLVANRFIPFVRGFLLYGAGALRLRFWPANVYAGLSSLLWVALLWLVGGATAGSWAEIVASFQEYSRLGAIFWTVVVAAILAFLGLRTLALSGSRGVDPDVR